MKSLLKNVHVLALVIGAAVCCAPACAQDDEIETQFKRITPQDEARLRELLAQPIPEGALPDTLRKHFQEKDAAALHLGEPGNRESVLREAVKRLPDAYLKNNLARQLLNRGAIQEGNALMQEAIASAGLYNALYMSANAACDMVAQNNTVAAQQTIAKNLQQLAGLSSQARLTWQQREVARSLSRNTACLSTLHEQLGKYPQAISAAYDSEKHARKALALASPSDSATMQRFLREDVANSLARKIQALRAANQLSDADTTLTEYVRLSRELELPAIYLSGIYAVAGNIRFSQREFIQSEVLINKSDAVLQKLGYSAIEGNRPSRARDSAMALIGQKKWPAAIAVFDRLDSLAGNDAVLKKRVAYRFDRAVAYLGNGRYAQAADLLAEHVASTAKLNGDTHFFTAQARGLQGVALWRMGTPDSRAQALPLLKTAVRDYMAPSNAEYLENTGYRKERREEVFAAYLEALATTPGENAVDAIGPADWVRSGSVQDALNDAAVRAAASTPALADVVRREQDAKNEITGLRRYLSGEAGSASASPLPEVAAQKRARIAALEAERIKYQQEIKAKFPDYERLVRPIMPSAQDIARQLDASQALLMVLPTVDAVYVWAVASDKPAAFARVAMPEAEVNQLVARLRNNLDFASFKGVPTRFDNAAAYTLYQRLIAPVSSALEGKTQWIVATGGTLSQLPFAVLQTQASTQSGVTAPWLIKQAAIAQVPSLSAWLALRNIAKNKPANQPFIGWGDPTFSNVATNFAANATPAESTVRKVAIARGASVDDLTTEKLATRATAPSALRYADIPPLPETRDELLAIANTLSATTSDVILGAAATRSSVLTSSQNGTLANRRVVAFATHGLMAGDLPNLSQPALALAASSADASDPLAPLLTLEDVLTLKLNADWVVLSACNTAAADGRAEEALSGLARGFFYAGARSLLVTHWAVDSASATLLTTATFDHYIANPQAPKAESLRQAMIKVMAIPAFAHPAYWSPYALVGDGGR
ncbi:MAG: CHAT domain-containing protein [Vitreoscilla sp.]|nr:CHAT domain-containing protein [Polaromonas sp.]